MHIHASPLPYIGGKRWLARWLIPRFKRLPTDLVSPFFGGGTLELNLALRGVNIHAGDINKDLVNFWQAYLEDPKAVMDKARAMLQNCTQVELQERLDNFQEIPAEDVPSCLFLKTRLSYRHKGILRPVCKLNEFYCENGEWYTKVRNSGKVFGKSQKFWQTQTGLPITIEHIDYAEKVWEFPDSLLYCDPPYLGSENYNKQPFDHNRLKMCLEPHPLWILSYGDHPGIRELYSEFRIVEIPKQEILSLKMHHELLILSEGAADMFDLTDPEQLTLFS